MRKTNLILTLSLYLLTAVSILYLPKISTHLSNNKENGISWTKAEKDAFILTCSYTSSNKGFNDYGVDQYCKCSLSQSIEKFRGGPPKIEDWKVAADEISATCVSKILEDPLVYYLNTGNENLERVIDNLIEYDQYFTALNLLYRIEQTQPVNYLLEKVHLNYGLHSMNTFDRSEMRARMNTALLQFTYVLKINPENWTAREQIQQILDIYSTIPDRSPDEAILLRLEDVGFQTN